MLSNLSWHQHLKWAPIWALTIPLLTQMLANAAGKAAETSSSTWAPATHMGNLDGVPGSQLWPSLTQGKAAIWRVNLWGSEHILKVIHFGQLIMILYGDTYILKSLGHRCILSDSCFNNTKVQRYNKSINKTGCCNTGICCPNHSVPQSTQTYDYVGKSS